MSFADLEEIDMGMAMDMFVERGNDQVKDWVRDATQADIDKW